MNPLTEESHLISQSNGNFSEKPRPFSWQIFHGTQYLIGSICFTAGSCMYLTDIFYRYPVALTVGGWLFTIGSLIFLFADLQDWWDYRTGYCFDSKTRQKDQFSLHSFDTPRSSTEKNDTNIEVNIYGSMCGICFYLVGSILFIPFFENYLVIGEWFFIFGSNFCYLSLIWKIYRSGYQNSEEKFRFITIFNDLPSLTMDIASIIGNICFFIGTICFLPYISKSISDENRAAGFFIFGSGCFVLSSIILQYTICCSSRK